LLYSATETEPNSILIALVYGRLEQTEPRGESARLLDMIIIWQCRWSVYSAQRTLNPVESCSKLWPTTTVLCTKQKPFS